MGNYTYSVPVDDAVEVPVGRQNVRPRVEDRDPRDAYVGDELPMDPFHVMAKQYGDDVGRGLNFMEYRFEAIMHQLPITPSVGAPPITLTYPLGRSVGPSIEEVRPLVELEIEMMRKKNEYP
ncbi:unnamed protein product [Lactuca virosa]|uniref:Uncharacterized protein n=1 Tax=Lactuca virosa TaxID=75947 RepID=A0AAU9P1D2_9ASTR|nr:unnamed protein product [Lactuca virosa]